MVLQENIAAISTPSGVGGIAVIRISGEDPLSVLKRMFRPRKGRVEDFTPYRLYTGDILADGFTDHGMAVYFRAPQSYTGENVVEIHCHGGIAVQRGILERCYALGCRPAAAGEFTRRAFLNGKLSLSSSEGVIDMIHAESRAAVAAGYALYREKLYDQIESVRKDLTFVLAQIDAEIDFPEEGLEEVQDGEILAALHKAEQNLAALAATYQTGSMIKSGVKVALCGKPNTGKSSLLNALIGREKAIVTEIAGTTRDVVEGDTELGGVRFLFSDTAGIRDSEDAVEKIGVGISKRAFSGADVALVVTDGREEADGALLELIKEREKEGRTTLLVLNKSDLPAVEERKAAVEALFALPAVVLSAKTGEGVESLKTALLSVVSKGKIQPEAGYLTERRHYDAVESARASLLRAAAAVGSLSPDLLSVEVEEAWHKLGEITGATAPEEVIDEIFSKFCVGK